MHTIQLRGPWDLDATPERRRLDLPAAVLPGPGLRLCRRFRRPPRLAGPLDCRLRLDDVPGLRRVDLNGATLARYDEPGLGPADRVDLQIGPLLAASNLLCLEADRPDPDPPGPWGRVALVFDDEGPAG